MVGTYHMTKPWCLPYAFVFDSVDSGEMEKLSFTTLIALHSDNAFHWQFPACSRYSLEHYCWLQCSLQWLSQCIVLSWQIESWPGAMVRAFSLCQSFYPSPSLVHLRQITCISLDNHRDFSHRRSKHYRRPGHGRTKVDPLNSEGQHRSTCYNITTPVLDSQALQRLESAGSRHRHGDTIFAGVLRFSLVPQSAKSAD